MRCAANDTGAGRHEPDKQFDEFAQLKFVYDGARTEYTLLDIIVWNGHRCRLCGCIYADEPSRQTLFDKDRLDVLGKDPLE